MLSANQARVTADERSPTGVENDDDGELVIIENSESDNDNASVGSLVIRTADGNPSSDDDRSSKGSSSSVPKLFDPRSNEEFEDPVPIILGKPISDKSKFGPANKEDEKIGQKCLTCRKIIPKANLPHHFHVHPPSKHQDTTQLARKLKELINQTALEIMPLGRDHVRGKVGKFSGMASINRKSSPHGENSNVESDSEELPKISIRPLREIHRKPELLDPPVAQVNEEKTTKVLPMLGGKVDKGRAPLNSKSVQGKNVPTKTEKPKKNHNVPYKPEDDAIVPSKHDKNVKLSSKSKRDNDSSKSNKNTLKKVSESVPKPALLSPVELGKIPHHGTGGKGISNGGGNENEQTVSKVSVPEEAAQLHLNGVSKPAPVAKKSCSSSKANQKKEVAYQSESDDPVSPVKSPGSTRKRKVFIYSDSEDDEVPLIIRLKQEAEARGEIKIMPKPSLKSSKKRPLMDNPELLYPNKKHRLLESGSSKDIEKKPKQKKPTILKRSNPNFSKHAEAAAEVIGNEMKKDDPDMEVLLKAMKETFMYRKHMYNSNADIARVLSIFPSFREYRCLKKEFELLEHDTMGFERKLQTPMMQAYQSFAVKYQVSPDPVIANAKEELRSDPSNKLVLRDVQLLCLAFQKTNGKLLGNLYRQRASKENKFKGVTPTIDIKNNIGSKDCKITVYCEKLEICEVPNFYEGLLCAYYLYWIFNLQYEQNAQPLYEFFDSLETSG